MESLKRSKDYRDKNSFSDYLKTAHVHGFKFLAHDGKFEKLFWSFIILTSLFAMSCLLFDMSKNYDDYTIESINNGQPLHEIPFPAITICSETKFQKSMVNVTDAYHNFHYNANQNVYEDDDLSNIEAITHVCDAHLFSQVKIKSESPTPGEKFIDLLRDVSIPQNKILLFCKFHNHLMDCGDLFKEVITDDGICYTFNMQNASEIFSQKEYRYAKSEEESMWDLKDGYKDQNEFNVYPNRALPNTGYGINVVLSLKASDLDFMCKGPVQGFKVRIHSPDEFPQISEGFFRIPLNEEVIVGLKSEIISDETPFDGTCHTSDSKVLKYFKKYSQLNCLEECRSKYVQKKCGCVKFTMSHDNDTTICTQHDTQCIVDAVDKFYTTQRFDADFPCDCKPSCNKLKYDTDITSAIFNYKQVFAAFNSQIDEEFPQAVMSRLSIYFKDDHYTLRTLSEGRASWSEKAGQIGGIIALFLGASLLSVVELFYWILRRIFN